MRSGQSQPRAGRVGRLAVAALLCSSTSAFGLNDGPVESLISIGDKRDRLAVEDVDRDGDKDLLFATATGFNVHYMDAQKKYPSEPDAVIAWPSDHMAWDLADLDGDGAVDICMLIEGQSIMAWRPDAEGQFGTGTKILETNSQLPRGVSRMRFMRDVDYDGRIDLVLPASGKYQILLQQEDGAFADAIQIEYDADVRYAMGNPDEIDARFGQEVRVPWFTLEDFDGDGATDLIARTDQRISFHRASPELAATPSWTLDLSELRDELPDRDGVDLDDLFANITGNQVSWRIEDLDGKYPRELIVQIGGTFKIYTSGSVGGPQATADQVLKSSGNVLYAFFRNVSGSEYVDLQIVRGEQVSLARVLRYLILPGSLDFDLFTYENEGGLFSRKPTRRNNLSLKIPRLLSLIDDSDEIEDRVKAQTRIPARRFSLAGDEQEDDVADIQDGVFKVFRDCAPADNGVHLTDLRSTNDVDGWIESLILNDLDQLDDGGTKTLALDEIDQWRLSPGAQLRAACEDQKPILERKLAFEVDEPSLAVRDLDGDGNADFILVGQIGEGFELQILVSR